MAFEENRILFGHDPTERIVSAELDGVDAMKIYVRDAHGATTIRRETFRPFFWINSDVDADALNTRKLHSDLVFDRLVECENWPEFLRLRTQFKTAGAKHFALGDPIQQFLV